MSASSSSSSSSFFPSSWNGVELLWWGCNIASNIKENANPPFFCLLGTQLGGLILAPTRELAAQIYEVTKRFVESIPGETLLFGVAGLLCLFGNCCYNPVFLSFCWNIDVLPSLSVSADISTVCHLSFPSCSPSSTTTVTLFCERVRRY